MAKAVATIPALGSELGLNRYMTEIKKFPILVVDKHNQSALRRINGKSEPVPLQGRSKAIIPNKKQ